MKEYIHNILRARYVPRFSTHIIQDKDNVAEHTYLVSSLTLLAVKLLHEKGVEVDQGKALAFAIMHDYEETMLGDIISTTKNGLSDYSKKASDAVFSSLSSLPKKAKGSIYGSWAWAKHNTIEGRIVTYADALAALSVSVVGQDSQKVRCKIWDYILSLLDEEKSIVFRDTINDMALVVSVEAWG